DPLSDAETVETELMLADLESLEKRVVSLEKRAKGGEKEAKLQIEAMNAVLALLRDGKPARQTKLTDEQRPAIEQLGLLKAKPIVFVANVDEGSAATGNAHSKRVAERAAQEGAAFVAISAKIESEIAQLGADERNEFLQTLGLEEPGLNRLIRAG